MCVFIVNDGDVSQWDVQLNINGNVRVACFWITSNALFTHVANAGLLSVDMDIRLILQYQMVLEYCMMSVHAPS
jgi:hypothetical protein